ncbi:hypothetical protein ACKWTF_010146 [Chironomus riparius]
MCKNFMDIHQLQLIKQNKMKFLIILTILISSVVAKEIPEYWKPIDFSKVVKIENTPGFWDQLPKIFQEESSVSRNRRIFGGKEVEPNNHPYQVAILSELNPTTTGLCGGTILNTQAILTAAHCIDRFLNATIIAGAHNIQILESTQQRITAEFASFRIHPGWNGFDFMDDIGIVILPTTLKFNGYVTPTRLPFGHETETFAGEWSRVIGWGMTGEGSGSSSVLREAYNTVLTNQDCINVWGADLIRSTILCTSSIGQGACSSDSGGSLTVSRDSRPVQIGIVNFGSSRCGSNLPVAFARVTRYLDWIVANQNV